jgi:exonuclease I
MSVKAEKDGAIATHMEETTFSSDEKVKQGDYSGAVRKTDKAEIALVRKLDMRIMPALFCMYFL